jgi:two-component system NtrC family sensor kinase
MKFSPSSVFSRMPLRQKTISFVSALFLLFFISSALLLLATFSAALNRQSENSADLIAESIAGISAFHIYNYSYYSLDEVTRKMMLEQDGQQTILGVLVLDTGGRLLNPSGFDFRRRLGDLDPRNYFVKTKPAVFTQGPLAEEVGAVQVYFSRQFVRNERSRMVLFLGAFVLISTLMLIMSTSLYTRKVILDPLSDLQRASNRVARGEYDVGLNISRKDELGDLARDISLMAGTIEESINRITEVNNSLEEKVRQRTRELVDAERMAAISNMVIGMAHEINTPVGNIILAASHLQEISGQAKTRLETSGSGDPPEQLPRQELEQDLKTIENAMDIILEGARQASELIERFRSLTVLPAEEQRQGFDLFEHIQVVSESILSDSGASATQVRMEGERPMMVSSYRGYFTRILSVLIDNALTHGGLEANALMLGLEIAREGNSVYLRFSNNGTAISQDKRQLIYEPFYTTHRGAGHTGLGLYVAYSIIVNEMNGTIRHENPGGGGVAFHMTFPNIAMADDSVNPEML